MKVSVLAKAPVFTRKKSLPLVFILKEIAKYHLPPKCHGAYSALAVGV